MYMYVHVCTCMYSMLHTHSLVWFVVAVLFDNSLVFKTGAGLIAGVEVWRWVGLKETLLID